jgi:hypothetical protein
MMNDERMRNRRIMPSPNGGDDLGLRFLRTRSRSDGL